MRGHLSSFIYSPALVGDLAYSPRLDTPSLLTFSANLHSICRRTRNQETPEKSTGGSRTGCGRVRADTEPVAGPSRLRPARVAGDRAPASPASGTIHRPALYAARVRSAPLPTRERSPASSAAGRVFAGKLIGGLGVSRGFPSRHACPITQAVTASKATNSANADE